MGRDFQSPTRSRGPHLVDLPASCGLEAMPGRYFCLVNSSDCLLVLSLRKLFGGQFPTPAIRRTISSHLAQGLRHDQDRYTWTAGHES